MGKKIKAKEYMNWGKTINDPAPLKALSVLVDRLAIKEYDKKGNLVYWQSTTDKEYNIIEKSLKALEVIKENVFLDEDGNIMPKNKGKTQEEADLLKEVLL